jgi:hypothetical protein
MFHSKAYPIPLVHYLLARLMKILATTLFNPLDTNFELVLQYLNIPRFFPRGLTS